MTVLAKNGADAVAEQESVEVMAPQEVTIKITLPDVVTIGMWQTYVDGRDSDTNLDMVTRRYMGALALIKAGFVHIEGTGKLKELAQRNIKAHSDIPAAVMGLLVRTISYPVEAALDKDFLDFFKD